MSSPPPPSRNICHCLCRKRGRAPMEEGTRKRPWSDLPPEILSMIGNRLCTRMDVLRFRSICSSFRSSIPAPRPWFPFRIPRVQRSTLFLKKTTVYALETPGGAATGPGLARWLLKLEETELGHMRMLSVFSRWRIRPSPRKFPMTFDFLQYRIVELCRGYFLDRGIGGLGQRYWGWWSDQNIFGLNAVMHPDCCVWSDLDQCSVYFIDEEGRLAYWKYGDENGSLVDDPKGGFYEDIAVYEGEVCVVDKLGSVSQLDSSFRLRSTSAGPCGFSGGDYWKHLVVSSGDLYVVDRHERSFRTPEFRAYRLDRQCGRWEEVSSLGNSAFFICDDCSFAVPAPEFAGCKGDCIYYKDRRSCWTPSPIENFLVFGLAERTTQVGGRLPGGRF